MRAGPDTRPADAAAPDPVRVQRNVVLGLLLALAAAAWALLVWQGSGDGGSMAMASLTMGMRAPLFLAIWVVMMVAMMFRKCRLNDVPGLDVGFYAVLGSAA